MAARNQCGHEADALLSETTSGVTPPLLPTLLVAVVLAAASFYCPERAQSPAAPPAAVVRMSAITPEPEAADTVFVPASLAFPRQFPLVAAAHVEAATRQGALQQIALQPPHRPAARIVASRRTQPTKGAQAPADSALVAAAAAEPVRADPPAAMESEDGVLPALALPFAPTIRAVTRVGALVGIQSAAAGAEAAALGDVMVNLVGRLR